MVLPGEIDEGQDAAGFAVLNEIVSMSRR